MRVGAVFSPDGRPMAFFSEKLTELNQIDRDGVLMNKSFMP